MGSELGHMGTEMNQNDSLCSHRRHTRIVGMDPWDGLNGLGLGPGLDLNYLCHDLNQESVS